MANSEIHHSDWSPSTRQHPGLAWFEKYTRTFDSRSGNDWAMKPTEWHTEDFTFIKSDGTVLEGREKAWGVLTGEVYAVFKGQRHQPYWLTISDTDYGWEMVGLANCWLELVGEPAGGEGPKRKDDGGKEWDMSVPGAFRFEIVKGDGEGENRLRRTEICSDSVGVVGALLKRGVLSAKDVGLA